MSVAFEVDSLLNQLVGTPELEEQTTSLLRAQVCHDIARGAKPYAALESRVCQSIFEIIASTMIEPVALDVSKQTSAYEMQEVMREWDIVSHQFSDHEKGRTMLNAMTGTSFLIRGLSALGKIYATKADEPQELQNVERNTRRVVRHYQRIAFSDNGAAAVSVEAMAAGADPQTIFEVSASDEVAEDSFIVTKHDGQLDVDLRYKDIAVSASSSVCPATAVRVQRAEARKRSGLLVYNQVIGSVSINPILAAAIDIRT